MAAWIGVKAGADGRPDLHAALASLANAGITRLLVEGGPAVARAFLDAHLVDEIILFKGAQAVSPKPTILPFVDHGVELLDALPELVRIGERRTGRDKLVVYRSRRFWQG
jgi:diaminohydroxyphosphoribosylaminopyrimidine deaminase/5-amino-6-(5-phosphoribosylamino)uracil reductase